MRTTRKRAIALALAPIMAVLLASCGGGGDSSDQSGGLSETTKAQAPASTTPGATGSTSAKEHSAAAAKARKQARAKAREAQRKPRSNAGIEVLKRQAEEQRRGAPIKKPKRGNSPPTTTKPNPQPGSQPSATPQQVLGNNAQRVCKNLGVPILAKRFNAEATPEAVATAYAQTYPEALRAAVHDGCLSAFNQ